MDTKLFIKKLNQLFCNQNKEGKKYSEVWLSDADFGGLYNSGKYILNVKHEGDIDRCDEAIREVFKILEENVKDEIDLIWSVNIYDSSDRIHCQSGEIEVFNQAESC